MSLSRELVRSLRAQASSVPSELAKRARLHIADSIGIALAAHGAPALAAPVFNAMGLGAGEGACRVIGCGQGLPAAQAAFANSALAHLLDYDDIHDEARLHPTTVTLPAALAAADVSQARGEAVRTATLLGSELMCRLGVACAPTGAGAGSDWFLTQLFGYFGAAFAAGHVLGLSEDALVSGLGFAYMQAAGGKEAGFGVGSNARAIYPAFAAMGGVTAALLARAGMVGPEGALDGAAGLFRIYLGGEPPALRATLLDRGWLGGSTSFKPWPCCRLSHPYVAAALALRDQLPQTPIERVVVAVNASAAKLCRPLDERRAPRTLQDAKYSIPFLTAFALARGRPDLRTLEAGVLNDRAVLDLAARIEIDERLPDKPGHPPAEIEVSAAGCSFASPRGLAFELDELQIKAKFFDCLAYVGAQPAQAAALWDRLKDLDRLGPGQWWDSMPQPSRYPAASTSEC